MNYPTMFFLGARLIAQGSITAPLPPHSQVYFCHTCGDVWGRIVVGSGDYFSLNSCPCAKHSNTCVADWGRIPGSFLPTVTDRRDLSVMRWAYAWDTLPAPILQYELSTHLAHLERTSNERPADPL